MVGYKQQYSRAIKEYYQKGISALNKKNYDYAIEMLLQVVLEEPLFFEAREKLHLAEREKVKERPPSLLTLMFIKLNNFIPWLLAIFHESRKDHEKAIAFYEDLLKLEPTNKLFLRRIANLALKKQWVDVAIVASESLFALDDQNAEMAKTIGELYRNKENIEKAGYYFKKSLEIDPYDQTVSKSLKDLEALRTIQTGRWDETGSYREKLLDEDEAKALETEGKKTSTGSMTSEKITALQEKIKQNPNDLSRALELADLYLETDKLRLAAAFLSECKNKFPHNEKIQNRLNQLQKKENVLDMQQTEEELKANPTDEGLVQKVKDLKTTHTEAELKAAQERVALYPNDLSLKYALGEVYFELGQHDKAIVEFQQAVKDPAFSIRALSKLGLSFFHKGMYDLAAQQFNKALEKLPGMNPTSKETLYHLGTTLEAMGKEKEAIEAFKKIYEADISYRDVAQKMDSFYKK
ncbi:MAG: tetratricopeptide repeat protein [Candidatus Omnitrophica bacterium]|nr:tetratricopeptide repeat protein [Candidatus Omnitrophota bacterium]